MQKLISIFPRQNSSSITKVGYALYSKLSSHSPLSAEQFHSTPETQTDESYNHPEDLEHFAHHENIEHKEAEKEAEFQGLSVEEVIRSHEHPEDFIVAQPEGAKDADSEHVPAEGADGIPTPEEAAADPIAAHPHDEQIVPDKPVEDPFAPSNPKVTRLPPPEKAEPQVKFKDAKAAGERKGEWGQGEEGYKAPSDPSDKMRFVVLVTVDFTLLMAGLRPTEKICHTR